MPFIHPTPAELKSTGSELGLELSDAESRELADILDPVFGAYDFLDAAPDALPEVRYPDRPYEFPAPEDNPYKAWYVRTSIKGAASGPLSGRTVAIKDVIFVAGVPMMNGASILEGFVPDYDATVVTRLLDAGAEITGKAVCEYFCVSGSSCTASTGHVDNPRKPGYSTGGSSSGCGALVAAGHVDMAVGSDQAGSVREPASWSGVCGMKPTFGLVPFTGAMSQEFCVDHLGPITANVADNALMLEVLAGHDGYDGRQQNLVIHKYTDALGKDVRGMKIGVLKEGFGQDFSDEAVDECVRAAAARYKSMGAVVGEVSIPEQLTGIAVWAGILFDGLWQTMRFAGLGQNYEGVYSPAQFAAMEHWLDRLGETPANVQLLMLAGKYLERFHGRYYFKAKNLGFRLRAAYDAALKEYDLLLLPTARRLPRPNPAPLNTLTAREVFANTMVNIENTCQTDVTGHPGMSIPCGMRDGLPIGMMLIGNRFDEPAIYRAAHAFEQSGDWKKY